jgi:hypothetical protein
MASIFDHLLEELCSRVVHLWCFVGYSKGEHMTYSTSKHGMCAADVYYARLNKGRLTAHGTERT